MMSTGSGALRSAACGRAHLLLVAAVVAGTACAAAEPPSPLQQPTPTETAVRVEAESGTTRIGVRNETVVERVQLPLSRKDAWQHLRAAWTDIGLAEPAADERAFRLTLNNHVITRRLGRTPLSRYLNCGSNANGWNADMHRIRLNLAAALEEAGTDASRLNVRLEATAQSTEGTGGIMPCTSNGALESLLLTRVQERIDGKD